MTTYNHAYTFAFCIGQHRDPEGNLTGQEARDAIQAYLNKLSDDEILENIGAPYDTYEED